MDNFKYFPRFIAENGDLVLSISQITGKMLIAGKLSDKSQSIDNSARIEDNSARIEDNSASFEVNSARNQYTTVSNKDIDPVLKAIYNCDAQNPVKRALHV